MSYKSLIYLLPLFHNHQIHSLKFLHKIQHRLYNESDQFDKMPLNDFLLFLKVSTVKCTRFLDE